MKKKKDCILETLNHHDLFVLNDNQREQHRRGCSSVLDMEAFNGNQEDLILQTKDGSQCLTWSHRQLTYMSSESKEIPLVLAKVYGRRAERIDLSFCSLTSLKGLEQFTCLTEIILDNNRLTDDVSFPGTQNLSTLSLNKNLLKRLDSLLNKLSSSFPKLQFLSLLGNECCPDFGVGAHFDDKEYIEYRTKVISKFPRLSFLDSSRVKSSERRKVSDSSNVLPIVIRPTDKQLERLEEEDDEETSVVVVQRQQNSPTTSSTTAYGKVRYRYTGKHSEGNRFIRNNQL